MLYFGPVFVLCSGLCFRFLLVLFDLFLCFRFASLCCVFVCACVGLFSVAFD